MPSNGYDQTLLQSTVRSIERCATELLSERGSYMQRCRTIREEITGIYDSAKEAGIPRKELRALIKTRELERKIEETRLALEADEQATFEVLVASLGEFANTPLGDAALKRAQGDMLDQLATPAS